MNIFNELLYCNSNRIAVRAGRRSGKTTAVINYAIYYARTHPNTLTQIVARNYRASIALAEQIRNLNGSLMFDNGSSIFVTSTFATSHAACIILDETDVPNLQCRPETTIIQICPNGIPEGYEWIRVSTMNATDAYGAPIVSPEELERCRSYMGDSAFKAEFMGSYGRIADKFGRIFGW